MVRMRRITVVSLAFMSLIVGMWAAKAGVEDESPYTARVRCQSMAEDTAAHLKLVVYEVLPNGQIRLVYRCLHGF